MTTLKKSMKTKPIDKNADGFLKLSFILIAFVLILFLSVGILYFIPALHIWDTVIALLFYAGLGLILFILLAATSLLFSYKNSFGSRKILFLTKIGFAYLLPLLIFVSQYFKKYKSNILNFYIKLNNIITLAAKQKYLPKDILILLPHCLQNSECNYKITGTLSNCRQCGNCKIGGIRSLGEKYSIGHIEVVTGGSAARLIVSKLKPRIIIAIACERDLSTGISDIKKIPVIALLNMRPNGPCRNTDLNITELTGILEKITAKDI